MMGSLLKRYPRIFASLCFALLGRGASGAEFSPEVWVNPGVYSLHFDRSRNLREDNVGFGAEVLLSRDHALLAGSIINSDRERTHYVAYQWRPLHWKPADINVSAGAIVGAFDGYPRVRNGGWFVAPLPVVAIEGGRIGVNLTIVPSIKDRLYGAVAVQVKLRVW